MKKFDYEKSVERLEEIVSKLEDGNLSLEESMKLFEEGTKLSAACYDVLKKAEQKITDINSYEAEEGE
ncbi:MAG: exodeoxyribonuclease VII small subunit [Clostridia bacterium]|nr:exodeoxyribonuclease VII small subunit [Clostridia bacterium]